MGRCEMKRIFCFFAYVLIFAVFLTPAVVATVLFPVTGEMPLSETVAVAFSNKAQLDGETSSCFLTEQGLEKSIPIKIKRFG